MAREARYARIRRITELTRRLTAAPGRLFTLGELAGVSGGVARSTISEDVSLIDEALRASSLGIVETVPGAAGGVRFYPLVTLRRAEEIVQSLLVEFSDPERIIPGGFLYMTDIIFSPRWAEQIGAIFATRFMALSPDAVLTMETKGIPLALSTSRALGVPMAVARRESRVTEGPAIGLNYVSSSGRIGTMSLPRRAIAPGSRVLLVDDFLKGGSTARGLSDLCDEIGAASVGMAALCETPSSQYRLRVPHLTLLSLEHVDDVTRSARLSPSRSFAQYLEEASHNDA